MIFNEQNILPPLVCVLVVWGEQYTRLFLELALPCHLAPGNLPKLAGLSVDYLIYTTADDAHKIRQSAVFLRLQQYAKVKIYTPFEGEANRYKRMTEGHQMAIRYADNIKGALIFLTPDSILSNGSMEKIRQLLAQDVRVISIVGLRLTLEAVMPLLFGFYEDANHCTLKISSREVMSIALKNLHTITQSHIWEGAKEMVPNNLFWQIDNEGLLGRCFHLHPLMVYPRLRYRKFYSTIDYDYPQSVCPALEEHYVVQDSDEMCICELTTQSRKMSGVSNASIKELINFSEYQVNKNHWRNSNYIIKLHSGVITQKIWTEKEKESEKIFNQVAIALNKHSIRLLFSNPKLLILRLVKEGKEAKLHMTLSRDTILKISLGYLAKFAIWIHRGLYFFIHAYKKIQTKMF